MKKFLLIFCTLICVSTIAHAQEIETLESYGWQWPLELSHDDAGAYRVVLDHSVYHRIYRRDLLDIEVRNAAGEPVPTDVLGPAAPLAAGPQRIAVPHFDLPAEIYSAASWRISRETSSEGQIRRVETEHSYESSGPPAGTLVDASRVRDPIHALELSWPEVDADNPIDLSVVVETSEDLESWRVVLPQGQLVDLRGDGERVLKNRLEFAGAQDYLRIRPLDDARQRFIAAHVIVEPPRGPAEWQWTTLEGESVEDGDEVAVHYLSDGRFPAAQADLILDSNSAAEWTLESRESSEQPWTRRAGPWIGFQIDGGVDRRSRAQTFAVTRDRHWRLASSDSTGEIPQLRLGYRPEVLVFLAKGDAPFTLVAGSASAIRNQAPLSRLLRTLRAELGNSWNPPPAYLGPVDELEGSAATEPLPEEKDWTTWLLWIVLIAGTALVVLLALLLLKNPESEDPQS